MSSFPTELCCICFLILLFHFKSFFLIIPLQGYTMDIHICCRQAKLPVSANRKNSRNTWVYVQMEGPKITRTELSLLVKSLFMEKPSMWHSQRSYASKLNGCFRRNGSSHGQNGSHYSPQRNTELVPVEVHQLFQNALIQIK